MFVTVMVTVMLAAGYVGNERSGQRIGYGPRVNCVIWLKADTRMRLYHKKPVKNKSGQLRNEQQGYHPQDLVISQIFLHCVATGTVTPEQARFGDAQPNGKEHRRMCEDLRAAAEMLCDAQQTSSLVVGSSQEGAGEEEGQHRAASQTKKASSDTFAQASGA